MRGKRAVDPAAAQASVLMDRHRRPTLARCPRPRRREADRMDAARSVSTPAVEGRKRIITARTAPLIVVTTSELRWAATRCRPPRASRPARDGARPALPAGDRARRRDPDGRARRSPIARCSSALLDRVDGVCLSGGPTSILQAYGERRARAAGSDVARARRVRAGAGPGADDAQAPDPGHLPRAAGAQRRPWRHAAPAPARSSATSDQPPPVRARSASRRIGCRSPARAGSPGSCGAASGEGELVSSSGRRRGSATGCVVTGARRRRHGREHRGDRPRLRDRRAVARRDAGRAPGQAALFDAFVDAARSLRGRRRRLAVGLSGR